MISVVTESPDGDVWLGEAAEEVGVTADDEIANGEVLDRGVDTADENSANEESALELCIAEELLVLAGILAEGVLDIAEVEGDVKGLEEWLEETPEEKLETAKDGTGEKEILEDETTGDETLDGTAAELDRKTEANDVAVGTTMVEV
ncbi:hypothetical protein ASPCADRAFT_135659 [Aspergillus carbonarius ITEM 5010]|uniref:Uncharacterized protein n=1 Tax=Aspergillus carbonarius (strain ITEM 5010) TaxID=602072 RepID=A0A1R3R5U0_ASPC5|nr:hypothetical protein ASPCADRAFT_135659 [Aspergillus carbonarius ITEM 5010]